MSSAFTNLISKIENFYADRDYTTEDAEYLSRLAIVDYAKTQNALVASARQVPETSIENIIETAIHFNLDADPSEWMLFAANAVDNVLNYSHHGILASGLGEYTDFLPLGHPSRTNRVAMTASALSQVTALWVAGDPRIASEQARLDVYSAYATKPGSVEADYASAKLGALVAAGYVPEDVVLPITAAFKMSFAMRSAMAKALAAVRRRHRDGRFAEEFGRLRGFFSRKDGSIFSEDGRIVGAPAGTNNFQIEIKDSPEIPDGIYTIDAAKTAPVKAILSKRILSKVKGLKANRSIANPSKADIASAIPLEDFLKTRADAPEGWTKNEDGSFTSKTGQTVKAVDAQPEGDYMVEGAGESGAIDPNTPMFEIRDKNGELLGVGQNWAGLNKIAMTYDALNGEGDGTPEEPGLDQKPGEGSNWFDSAIDFDHLTDPQNWSQFKDGEATYTSPDGKLKLNWEPDGEGDVGFGATDLSGISVEYDGQPVGSFRATQRDLEEGDIEDGLKDLLKKESWFKPGSLVKTENDGNSYGFDTDKGYVEVTAEFDKSGKFIGYKVEKEARDLIDENREGSYFNTSKFKTKEEALADAEKFAETLNDEDKLSQLLNESYMDDPGFDQAPGKGAELSEAGKKIAKDLGDHKFFLEQDADGNYTGGEETYTSPDGRIEVKYRDGSWFDDEKGYIPWDEMEVSVDGKLVDSLVRDGRESWPDFLDRVAAMSENGLENPNYAEEKKAKREADRKAREDFYNSPEQVEKRAQAKWEKEQADAAQEQARESVDKEGLLKKVDDLANKIFSGDSGASEEFWVGDEDEDGYRNWGVYSEDGDEVASGVFGPTWDETDIASEIRSGVNAHLDKKLDELEPPAGLDQNAEAPAKPLSEKQMEPATDKQYAFLEELRSERDGISPVTEKAIQDALDNRNLTKAQMASILGEVTKKPFKPSVDPSKPTERQINSLQGYLSTKELTPDEMNDILAELDAGLDRDSIEKLTAKLRRRPDRQQTEGLDQSAGDRLTTNPDGSSEYFGDGAEVVVEKDGDKFKVTKSASQFLLDENIEHSYEKTETYDSEEEARKAAEDFAATIDDRDKLYDEIYEDWRNSGAGFDQAPGETKTLSPKMMEPATDAQYSYLQGLFESKNGVDADTAQAITEALGSKNLTKAQAGAFIGKLRELGDKENLGQYGKPSQKMIDSVKRDVYAKGLSDADREEILKDLENRSKGDVSSIISMLKDMDNVAGGMEKYIDSLVQSGDVDALKRLREDGRFGDYNVDLDNAISKLESGDKGFDQNAGKQYGTSWEQMKPELVSLAEDTENSDEKGYAFLSKEFVEGLDPNDIDDAYYLYSELMDAYKAMRPESEEGRALEARLKKSADDLLAKIESDMGPIEAAKRNPDDMGSTFEFGKVFDEIEDLISYYYPSDADEIADQLNDGDGGIVGDVRGGGWEGSVRFNEETDKWEARMTSPGQDSESYGEDFDSKYDAADWVGASMADENKYLPPLEARLLNDGSQESLEDLIKEYGDDPAVLVEKIRSAAAWFRTTRRNQGDQIANKLEDYADRVEQLNGGTSPKA